MKARVLVLVVLSMLVSVFAFGQATRTWVSGVGDDVNPCSRTAPCKTFAGAISKTAAGGEISVLDPGGYGAVTITKSITIDGNGTLASVLHSGVNGIVINALSTDTVILRNLSINGAGTTIGINGISVVQAKNVIVENCAIFGSQKGLSVTNSSNQINIFMSNVDIDKESTNGIAFQPSGTGFVWAHLDGVRISRVGSTTAHDGILQTSSVGGHYRNVTVDGAAGSGLHVNGSSTAAFIENSTFWRNGQHGAFADNGIIRVGSSSASQNTLAGFKTNLGTISTFKTNMSIDNGSVDSAASLVNLY
jgi:hypothetical protein